MSTTAMPEELLSTALLGEDYNDLVTAVTAAFNERELRLCVRTKLNVRLDEVVHTPSTLKDKVVDLVDYAERTQCIAALIGGLRASNSTNRQLQEVATRILSRTVRTERALERIVTHSRAKFSDPRQFSEQLAACERRVCRIEDTGGGPLGSGFLIAADLVMTCNHVVSGRTPSGLRFRFDTRASGGPVGASGLTQSATALVCSSGTQELDYAVIRLAERIGDAAVGSYQSAPARGWLEFAREEVAIGEAVLILQHPNGSDLVLAQGGVLGKSGTRLQYRVNTDHGSSGSPVLNTDWRVVGLHSNASEWEHNEGMQGGLILDHWERNGAQSLTASA